MTPETPSRRGRERSVITVTTSLYPLNLERGVREGLKGRRGVAPLRAPRYGAAGSDGGDVYGCHISNQTWVYARGAWFISSLRPDLTLSRCLSMVEVWSCWTPAPPRADFGLPSGASLDPSPRSCLPCATESLSTPCRLGAGEALTLHWWDRVFPWPRATRREAPAQLGRWKRGGDSQSQGEAQQRK